MFFDPQHINAVFIKRTLLGYCILIWCGKEQNYNEGKNSVLPSLLLDDVRATAYFPLSFTLHMVIDLPIAEAVWIKPLLEGLSVVNDKQVNIYRDNRMCFDMASNFANKSIMCINNLYNFVKDAKSSVNIQLDLFEKLITTLLVVKGVRI